MKKFITIFIICFSQQLLATNLTQSFYQNYNEGHKLNSNELQRLSNTKIIFIPGILAETFQRDSRSLFNISFLTKEYFGTQVNYLKKNYKLDVTRLKTSSKTLAKTKKNIVDAVKIAKEQNKKVIFIAHSLGGLALTEVLIENHFYKNIQGVIFLQTPFWGSPIANVYDNNTYYIQKILKPFLPFFNTSEEIISYIKRKKRKDYMLRNLNNLENLGSQVSIISAVSRVNKSFTLFRPTVNIMEYGCLTTFHRQCLTNIIYDGEKDQSDGMVSVKNGIFPKSDFLVLNGVDHGETVVNLGPRNINRKKMIETFIHLLLSK